MHNLNSNIIGWDVGGAHLKAALLDIDGNLLQVLQVPCALWRGLHELESAIDTVRAAFKAESALHAVTMTGELVDLFQGRQQGVLAISQLMHSKLTGEVLFYAGAAKFVPLAAVAAHWPSIASANWHASASLVGQLLEKHYTGRHGLLLDIGSTTADFVLFAQGQPACLGYTDAARMQSEELVYTGVVRTPLMAITQKINFQAGQTSLAAEYFATTADVYRLTGDLEAEDDMADTADGADKSNLCSARRIARMIGHDVEDAPWADWMALAQALKAAQVQRLMQVVLAHIARLNTADTGAVLMLGAGAGAFLVKALAQDLGLAYLDSAELISQHLQATPSQAASSRLARVCLPAYATAYLAFHQSN